MNWKEILKNKNNFAMPKKSSLLLILLVGLLLLVISFPTSEQEILQDDEKVTSMAVFSEENDFTSYSEYLEKRLANALEFVEGVGKTEIVITLESSGQKIIEKDQQSSSQTTSEEDSAGGVRNIKDSSSEKTSIYTEESDGTQTPYVSEEKLPEIKGVIVIAEGGDNAVVVQNITEAIKALFGIETHKIKIMKRTDT